MQIINHQLEMHRLQCSKRLVNRYKLIDSKARTRVCGTSQIDYSLIACGLQSLHYKILFE